MSRWGVRTAVVALGLSLLVLAGCVNVPSTGAPERVDATARPTQPAIDIRVNPPPPGASPRLIVSGFMQAMADYQPNYEIARMFLTEEARDAWRPESGVQIVSSDYFPEVTEDTAVLKVPLVGQLGPDRTYRGAGGNLSHDFKLVRDPAGEWRVSNPPAGLLITEYDFEQAYQAVDLHYFEPGMGSLVPDTIYLPTANLSASSVLRRLVAGPSEWLRPAVASAFPERTPTLSVPVDTSGVAEVSLGDSATALTEQQRTLLAAQTVWTLRQVPGINGVRFLVNGAPYVVPGANQDQVVGVDTLGGFGPVRPQSSTQLFGVGPEGVVRLDDGRDRNEPQPVAGPLGQLPGITEIAISPTADRAAVIVNNGTEVRSGLLGEQDPVSLVAGEASLRNPQYTRFGELLVLSSRNDRPVLWYHRAGVLQQVDIDLPKGLTLTDFRVAPDGVRVAVVAQDSKGESRLGLALLMRAGAPKLTDFRPVALTLPQGTPLRSVTDVAWSGATELVVLAGATADNLPRPHRLTQDGTELVALGGADDRHAVAITAAQRRETSGSAAEPSKVTVLDGDGRAWRYEDTFTWLELGEGLQALAYPG